jgi:hypothetical protein
MPKIAAAHAHYAARCRKLERALRRAHSLIDNAMGDTDPTDPDDPLLKAAQTIMKALKT